MIVPHIGIPNRREFGVGDHRGLLMPAQRGTLALVGERGTDLTRVKSLLHLALVDTL